MKVNPIFFMPQSFCLIYIDATTNPLVLLDQLFLLFQFHQLFLLFLLFLLFEDDDDVWTDVLLLLLNVQLCLVGPHWCFSAVWLVHKCKPCASFSKSSCQQTDASLGWVQSWKNPGIGPLVPHEDVACGCILSLKSNKDSPEFYFLLVGTIKPVCSSLRLIGVWNLKKHQNNQN